MLEFVQMMGFMLMVAVSWKLLCWVLEKMGGDL
jgi:hypothetical protein